MQDMMPITKKTQVYPASYAFSDYEVTTYTMVFPLELVEKQNCFLYHFITHNQIDFDGVGISLHKDNGIKLASIGYEKNEDNNIEFVLEKGRSLWETPVKQEHNDQDYYEVFYELERVLFECVKVARQMNLLQEELFGRRN